MPRRRPHRSMAHSLAPFGMGHTKPRHFLGMFRVLWKNRDNLRYAWKVLSRGVCDGCALGTSGMKDWTIEGTHLCMVRLELLRLNTMGALDIRKLEDVSALAEKSSAELRALGRLPYPLRRRRGEKGFERISWKEAWREVAARWPKDRPERAAMFVTSRGISNEVYYVAQKVMRRLGSNNVDNSARLCHSPSTAALKSTVGIAATTCSYKDWYETDLIVFFGSNAANDQPVAMKYLVEAKQRGARVLQVNALREPGMERYWVPSHAGSALFGTKVCDDTYLVRVGGDLAFLSAVQKVLIERGAVATEFIEQATKGYEELKAALDAMSMDELCAEAGCSLERVEAFADEIARADKAVLVWSMGITQHQHGSDSVRGIANLGLLREYVGRPGCGLMPIRGHSGVQGGAEMGAYSTVFPGGLAVNEENARHFSQQWGFEVPSATGLTTVDAFDAARREELDAWHIIGGNFLETMPQPDHVREALERVPLRIHSDIVLSSQMLVDPADTVLLFPSRTRYEQRDGATETSTERRVIFSPHIPGHDVGEARSEWEILRDLLLAVHPEAAAEIGCESGPKIREEIARAVPFYDGIQHLKKKGDQFQWGGPHLCADRSFPLPEGKARFVAVRPPERGLSEEVFLLATRRGKQFNSMIQKRKDPLTGADRDHILIAHEDAKRLGLKRDQKMVVVSEFGRFDGRAFPTECAPGSLQGHWPEINPLLPSDRIDPEGGVPDYNARVRVEV